MPGDPPRALVPAVSLSRLAGFPVSLREDGLLDFGPGVLAPEPAARKLEELVPVLLYPREEGPETPYLMYRGTGLKKDQRAMAGSGLRFDITVIYPGTIGSEYVKTAGHYHPKVPGQPWTYPEVYQVLSGNAHFLLQRGGEVSGEVEDFEVADFGLGDILVIPPFYGHVTANPGKEPLVMANWIAAESQSVYEPVRLRKGLAFYDVEYKGQTVFMPNDSYESHPKPRLLKSVDFPELGLKCGESMYEAWQKGADLGFLVNPSLKERFWESVRVHPRN
jgi:glucose-6-phosphate isomerase